MQPDKATLYSLYAASGFLPDLLPILPADASLSDKSEVPPENRGKVPGRLGMGGVWFGFGGWQDYEADQEDISRWSSWPKSGIGINTRRLVAFDVDVLDEALADALEKTILDFAGDLWPVPPVRYGNHPKRLILFRAVEPIGKRRLPFHLPADPVVTLPNGTRKFHHAVEVLGKGQQFVAHGIHPKTKNLYRWKDDRTPAEVGFNNLCPLSPQDVDELLRLIQSVVDMFGGELGGVQGGVHGTASPTPTGNRKAIGSPELLAADPHTAVAALKATPNDLDREAWVGIAHAFKAAVGGAEEFYPDFEDWCLEWPDNTPEKARKLWDSIRDSAVGAHHLFRHARQVSGFIDDAKDDFEALDTDADEFPDQDTSDPNLAPSKMDLLFRRYVYVRDLKVFVDLTDKSMLDAEQFSIQHADIGNHWEAKSKAANQYLSNMSARRVVPRVTYRPRQPEFIIEADGRQAVNLWRPSRLVPATNVSDQDVQWWLDHMAYIIPDEREREIVLDWCAYVMQGNKPHWAVLIGGDQGVGKDLAFQPLINAIGSNNVNIIGPDALQSQYTGWAANAQLVVIEEMMNYEKGEVGNRLKAYIAAPPEEVRVNEKFVKPYQVPNTAAYLFFTNHRNAVTLEKNDRRFFIIWAEVQPKDEDYYTTLARHIQQDSDKVAGWLLQRDVSKFAGKGRAPMTSAKRQMRREAMTAVDQWVEECVADGEAPFDTDVVVLSDVEARCPKTVREAVKGDLTKAITRALREVAGAVQPADAQDAVRLGKVLPSTGRDRGRLWIIRRHDMLRDLEVRKLLEIYWAQRDRVVANQFTD